MKKLAFELGFEKACLADPNMHTGFGQSPAAPMPGAGGGIFGLASKLATPQAQKPKQNMFQAAINGAANFANPAQLKKF